MMNWILSHIQHLIAYPSVAVLAHWFAQYEIHKIERKPTMTPNEIIAALQMAPQLLPELVQTFTDANKVLADFSTLMSKIAAVSKGQPPAAPAVPVA